MDLINCTNPKKINLFGMYERMNVGSKLVVDKYNLSIKRNDDCLSTHYGNICNIFEMSNNDDKLFDLSLIEKKFQIYEFDDYQICEFIKIFFDVDDHQVMIWNNTDSENINKILTNKLTIVVNHVQEHENDENQKICLHFLI